MNLWNESASLLDAISASAGWFAWRALWQGTLVAAAAWLFCRLFRSAPGRVHAWAWRAAAAKFALLAILPASAAVPLALPAETLRWLRSFQRIATFAPPPAAGAGAVSDSEATAEALSAPREEAAAAFDFLPPWLGRTLFLAACLLAALRLRRLAAEAASVARLLRAAAPIDDPAALALLENASRRLGLESSPRLLQVPGAGSPFAAGWLKPAVVVPTDTLARLSADELRLVCGHEAAHLKHGDALWNLLAAAVRAVYFFHPAVGLLERELRHAEELAADEAALHQQRWSPAEYAGTLVSILGRCGARRGRFATLAEAAGSASGLTRRLEFMKDRMTHENHSSLSKSLFRRGAFALAAAAFCLSALPWRLAAEEAKPEPAAKAGPVRMATIVVTEKKKNQPKLTLAAPKIVFRGSGPARFETGTDASRIEVSIRTDDSLDPPVHLVELKLVDAPGAPQEKILAMPKVSTYDDQEAVVFIGGRSARPAEDAWIEMKVVVRSIDPNAPPAATEKK